MEKPRLLRITTVPQSLQLLLRGQFQFMSDHGMDVYACSAGGKEADALRNEGVQHFVIPFTRKITPWQDLVCLIKLIVFIRRLDPAIVHTHTPKAGLLGMLASWLCGVKVRLHTVAGLPMMESKGLKRWVLRITERITYACAHKVYPNSAGLLSFIRQEITSHVPDSKFWIIGKGSSNGIDSNYFSLTSQIADQAQVFRKEHGIDPGARVFCFVGRVVHDKGIRELVAAFVEIVSQYPNSRLLLIGPFEDHLDPVDPQTRRIMDSNPNILCTGFLDDVRVPLAASDVFVFPSYREGFPNVVMQAACMGIPCIVSDINGSNEIIVNQKTGLVVPAKDSIALLKAMLLLAKDEALRQTFSAKARDFVVASFDQQRVWNALWQEYQQLLASR